MINSATERLLGILGHLTAYTTVPLEAMDDTAAGIRAIASELAAEPVSADLMERARNPIREAYQRSESQNAAWTSLTAMAQSDTILLDRRRARIAILKTLTPTDLQAAARGYFASAAPAELRVVPATP